MKRCQRCGKAIAPGGTAYAFEFRFFADFDGVVDPADDESFDRALAAVLREDPQTLEDQVYLEGRALLCPPCRAELLEVLGVLGGGGENPPPEEPADDEGPETVH